MELELEIPPEIQIKSTIRVGSVYYFSEESLKSPEPHYFIVLNINPHDDTIIFLVCASSQINKVVNRRKTCPKSTLVKITPTQYPDFKVMSIVDCNNVFERTVDQLIEKLASNKLRLKTDMDVDLIHQLRRGVIDSPLIEKRIKCHLKD